MAFAYNSPAELFIPKRKVGGGNGSTIVGSPLRRRPSNSQSRNFPRLGHSVRGCRLETSAMTAMRFAGCTKVVAIRCVERRAD
jgi:hypothetical protein